MVQPLLEDVPESSLVYVEGEYSHSLSRRAALPLGGARDVLHLEEQLEPHEASPDERRVADAALAVVGAPTLYARVDLLGGVVLELEVVEPSLYLSVNPSSADKLAGAVSKRLDRP
jgi:hypothetical protein